MENSERKAFVVFNPKAGDQDQGDVLRAALNRYFSSPGWTVDMYVTTGKEDITSICRSACDQGASLVVSAGGDGTLVGVANALVHRRIPLGILPLGTGNLLAKILGVPQKLEEAVQLLTGEHAMMEMDALQVGERYLLSNVSVGVSPEIMKETRPAQKKRLGMLAYFLTIAKRLSTFRLQRYTLTIDGQPRRVRATEVLVSNAPFFETATELYGPPDSLNDGKAEVYLASVQTTRDYLRLVRDVIRQTGTSDAKLANWESHHQVRIESGRSPQLVQGDGEVIGYTPVEIKLVPRAVQVVMPHRV